jgi:hypothetical protein
MKESYLHTVLNETVVATKTTEAVQIENYTNVAYNLIYDVTTPSAKTFTSDTAATGTLNITEDIILTSVAKGTARNDTTFTLEVEAPAANPTNTVLAAFTGDADAIVCTITPNVGTNNPASAQAVASVMTDTAIVLTSVARGTARNTETFTLQVAAAAANPTDTVLVAFSGTAAAITCTVTPNDGTNNSATPVAVTSAELVELINTGAITGKTATITDASNFRILQTATGGGAVVLADAGEGDGLTGTFASGTLVPVTVTTANLVQLINTGLITGKVPTITDASSLRALQTATGGDTTPLANSGEGDSVAATFAGGIDTKISLTNDTMTITTHGFVTGTKAALTTDGSLPTGLAATDYFIIRVDANTIQLASSLANALAGTEVDMTTEGSGTHTLTPTALSSSAQVQGSLDGTNYFNIGSAITVSADGNTVALISGNAYQYMRCVITQTAGQVAFTFLVRGAK